MKLGMMQPYFYPYLGYWQLMNAVDEYIIYDDVNYIKNGWINRNRIKVNGEPAYINLPLKKPSQNKLINEHETRIDEKYQREIMEKLRVTYQKAPYYKEASEIFGRTIEIDKVSLTEYMLEYHKIVAEYLGITTPIYSITQLGIEHSLRGQDRVVDVCRLRNADVYINAIGGTTLYDKEAFAAVGCELQFLKMDEDIVYPQGKGDFIPGLSILDVMMYNSQEEIRALLKRYTIC